MPPAWVGLRLGCTLPGPRCGAWCPPCARSARAPPPAARSSSCGSSRSPPRRAHRSAGRESLPRPTSPRSCGRRGPQARRAGALRFRFRRGAAHRGWHPGRPPAPSAATPGSNPSLRSPRHTTLSAALRIRPSSSDTGARARPVDAFCADFASGVPAPAADAPSYAGFALRPVPGPSKSEHRVAGGAFRGILPSSLQRLPRVRCDRGTGLKPDRLLTPTRSRSVGSGHFHGREALDTPRRRRCNPLPRVGRSTVEPGRRLLSKRREPTGFPGLQSAGFWETGSKQTARWVLQGGGTVDARGEGGWGRSVFGVLRGWLTLGVLAVSLACGGTTGEAGDDPRPGHERPPGQGHDDDDDRDDDRDDDGDHDDDVDDGDDRNDDEDDGDDPGEDQTDGAITEGPGPWSTDPLTNLSAAFNLGAPQSVGLDEAMNLWLLHGDRIGVLTPGSTEPTWVSGIGQASQGFSADALAMGSTVICGGAPGRAHVGYWNYELGNLEIRGRADSGCWTVRCVVFEMGGMDALGRSVDASIGLAYHRWRSVGTSGRVKFLFARRNTHAWIYDDDPWVLTCLRI